MPAYESEVWLTEDGGHAWKHLDDYPSHYAHCVAAHPNNPDLIYVGTEPAALFGFEDGGLSWKECVGLREVPEVQNWSFHGRRVSHIRDLRLASHDPDLIYLGSEVGSVVRSRDGGRPWEQSHGTDPDVHSPHIIAARPDTVCAATAQGLYHSDDSGDTWEPIGPGLERHYTVQITAAPNNHKHVLVAVASNAGRKGALAYLSTDAGRVCRRLGLSSEWDLVGVFAWAPLT